MEAIICSKCKTIIYLTQSKNKQVCKCGNITVTVGSKHTYVELKSLGSCKFVNIDEPVEGPDKERREEQ